MRNQHQKKALPGNKELLFVSLIRQSLKDEKLCDAKNKTKRNWSYDN